MGTLFSGIGLATGLNISEVVENLISISARPRDQLLGRIGRIDAQKAAFADISARISAMLANLTTLSTPATFSATKGTSSNEDVLSVLTGAGATPGSFDFIVQQLASSHQLVSRGFAAPQDRLTSGTLTIESAAARVNAATELDELNGFTGVQRGAFQITDAAGKTATINVADALTIDDVLERINGAGLSVQADLVGDSIRLTETTGGTVQVAEIDGGHVAADLGFGIGNTASGEGGVPGELVGTGLVTLSPLTPLSALNDGNGVRTGNGGGDFTINGVTVDLSAIVKPDTQLAQLNGGAGVRLGTIRIRTINENGSELTHEVDLSGAVTLNDVKTAIEAAVDDVSVTLTSSRLVVNYAGDAEDAEGDDAADAPGDDDEQQPRRLIIEDVTGNAARDLGIAGDDEGGKINGRDILTMTSVADVLAAINHAPGNDGSITARIDGTRFVIETAETTVGLAGVAGSQALRDLGLTEGLHRDAATGERIVRGLNTSLLRSLNGGRGYEMGSIRITLGDPAAGGQTLDVDLSAAETLGEVIDTVNAAASSAGLAITAGYDRTGLGVAFRSTDGVTAMSVADVKGTGTFAEAAGLEGQKAVEVRANLEKQYISEKTLLESLNNNAGVTLGKIRITNGNGMTIGVDLSGAKTLGDVISRINGLTLADGTGLGVTARINDGGDGIALQDTSGGTLGLKVEDETGGAARDLRIAGHSATGLLDGSAEINVTVSGSDTLDDLVQRINDAKGVAKATVLNDGTAVSPYRLQISSVRSGRMGELLIDDAGIGLGLSTLSRAQDAKVVIGTDASSGAVVTSATNTLTDVVPGITLNLTSASDDPVSVTIARDTTGVAKAIEGLVSAFNTAISRMDELTDYDTETERGGVLLADSTVRTVEQRLLRMFTGTVPTPTAEFRRLANVGISIEGGKLQLDTAKLQAVLDENPEALAEFFAGPDSGVAGWMKEQLEAITEADGLLDRRGDVLERQKGLLSDRVESMNARLDRQRERLTRQFIAMETAVAEMQAQQAAIGQLASLVSSLGA